MKVLIWKERQTLKNVGGPSGYLYNLNSFFEKENIKEIYYLERKYLKKDCVTRIRKRIKNIKKIFIKDEIEKEKIEMLFEINSKEKISKKYLDEFDFIHFHTTSELFKNIRNVENIKGKIILTSHSPELSSEETVKDKLGEKNFYEDENFLKKYKEYDYKSFERADYIIFP